LVCWPSGSWRREFLVSQCPGVPVSQCHGVPVSQCLSAPQFLGVPVSQCPSVPVSQCHGVQFPRSPVSQCPCVPVSQCPPSFLVSRCPSVPVSHTAVSSRKLLNLTALRNKQTCVETLSGLGIRNPPRFLFYSPTTRSWRTNDASKNPKAWTGLAWTGGGGHVD